jgi:hypothetical protein
MSYEKVTVTARGKSTVALTLRYGHIIVCHTNVCIVLKGTVRRGHKSKMISRHNRYFFLISLRGLLLILVSGCIFAGCSTFQAQENIQWVQQRHLQYSIVVLPPQQWIMAANMQRFDPSSLCIFVAPQNILVRSDVDVAFCLNHELGHLREYHERLAYHSQYAW